VRLSVVLITYNEEANLARTLASVQPLVAEGEGEIIVVDSHSTDRTVEIAKSFGAKVFVEDWKGFAAQKNSAIDKAEGDWILSLDADEEVSKAARQFTLDLVAGRLNHIFADIDGIFLSRHNYFLGRWIRWGGFYPDEKLRLFRRGSGHFENRAVHEDVRLQAGKKTADPSDIYDEYTDFSLLHHSYPTISDYIEHMNRYSSLGAKMALANGPLRFPVLDIFFRPILTFLYNYIFRLGVLDGHEGFLLHVNHAIYVGWKYAKAWEKSNPEKSATLNNP
jgi:glycosyltransferase involved in cell wall biosynthesis